ncbi:glycosyltransferase [Kitasatospora paranensis]|uniref:4,4'-diaponeurosporenoate glycosyltransferase n=1 Tax=Kitasatospora paranensis TaxID=258053 RepID=A0ABW2G2T4_9ACTN
MIRSVAVVVPARDEQDLLGGCLDSLRRAARHPRVRGIPVDVIVVADACTDGTAALARQYGASAVEIAVRNVGRARAAGSARALDLALGRGLALHEVWLAHTDADSRVPSGWLAHQLACAAAGWCAVAGTVRVTDWTGHPPATAVAFHGHYTAAEDAGAHPHVHGANLGVRADTYRAVGGFAPLPVGEDRALVAALEAAGVHVTRTGRHPVTTSARRDARARGGFGDFLLRLAR